MDRFFWQESELFLKLCENFPITWINFWSGNTAEAEKTVRGNAYT